MGCFSRGSKKSGSFASQGPLFECPTTGTFIVLILSILVLAPCAIDASAVVFAQPHATCGGLCDGSLAKPFPTIREALAKVADIVRINTVVLLPGIYTGPGNNGLTPSNAGIRANILGWHYETTIVDCQGTNLGFNLSHMYIFIEGITVKNCIGGGAVLNQAGLTIKNTRWINNTAEAGGAIKVFWGGLIMRGINIFINNTATIEGGAIAAYFDTIVQVNGKEILSGNTATLRPQSANFYGNSSNPLWGIRYPPGGSAPPLVDGPAIPSPVAYINGSFDCSDASCDGTAARPFNFLQTVTWPTQIGGTIHIAPGYYSGPGNTNLTWANADLVVSRWPGTVGRIVIDCENTANGLFAYNLALTLSDITFKNCLPSAFSSDAKVGGGAILASYSRLTLRDTHFINNTSPLYSGGALFVYRTELQVNGGSFVNNTAAMYGGAVRMRSAVARFSNGVEFSGNRIVPADQQSGIQPHLNDVMCTRSEVQNDGTVSFAVGDSVSCFTSVASANTAAVFPGSLNGILYPKDAFGNTASDIFAGLEFGSVVELDGETGIPIECTRLSKQELTWSLAVYNRTEYLTLEYDAFGPSNEFIQVVHNFFLADTTYDAIGAIAPIDVKEGMIKTSLQVAFWPFRSKSNRLAINLITNTTAQIFGVTKRVNSDQSTDFEFKTKSLTATFNALPYAVYDVATNVQSNVDIEANVFDTGVSFQLTFTPFTMWMGYDPQFSVLLADNNEGDGDGETPVGLIVGLTVGLTAAAIVVSIALVAGIWVILHVRRSRIRSRMLGIVRRASDSTSVDTVTVTTTSSTPYSKMEEDD